MLGPSGPFFRGDIVEFKKFKSPDHTERYFTLDSGHAFRVYGEWIDLPEFAWTTAYSHGCVSEDMVKNAMLEGLPSAAIKSITEATGRDKQIENVLRRWIDNNEQENFTNAGTPNAKKVGLELGLVTTKNEVMEVFYMIQEAG